jgi:hypothetical protein
MKKAMVLGLMLLSGSLFAETVTVSGTVLVDTSLWFNRYFLDTDEDAQADFALGFGPYWYEAPNGLTRPENGDTAEIYGLLLTAHDPDFIVVWTLNGQEWRQLPPPPPPVEDSLYWSELSGVVSLDSSLAFDRYFLDTNDDGVNDFILNFGPAAYQSVSGAARPENGTEISVYGLVKTLFNPDMMIVYTLNGETWRYLPGEQPSLEDYLLELPSEELSEAELAGLNLMREEEKLARDVYAALYEKWHTPIFRNISRSEGFHMHLVAVLMEKYELEDPASETPGVFNDETLQALYEELVASGSNSLMDALMVGALIEDLDIFDLDELISESDNIDLLTVWQNLQKGSRNHMRAFNRRITALEGVYSPQYISQEAFDLIITTPWERGPVDANGDPLILGEGEPGGNETEDYTNVDGSSLASKSILMKSFPNPFNPVTTIHYTIPANQMISLTVYDVRGNLVKTLHNGYQNAGEHQLQWDGTNNANESVASGVYLVRLNTPASSVNYRVMFLK